MNSDYDEIVAQYITLVGEQGIEAAEEYLRQTFQDTTVPEEVAKEIEVYLMREREETSADSNEAVEVVSQDEPVTESTESQEMTQVEDTLA